MTIELITVIVTLIFLEGVLSLDNAAVLGALVRPLPADEPIPWPRGLQGVGRWLDPLLGMQRGAALRVGLLGAYLGRAVMLVLATYVMANPWLRLVGALYLIYLALNHFGDLGHASEEAGSSGRHVTPARGFWSVVLLLELADLAFSLDNVVAAVALSDRFWVVMVGVMLGIVMMRFAAGVFSRMIDWEPALEHAAYLLILAIGTELLLDDLFGIHLHEYTQFVISVGILVLTVAFARNRWLRPLNRLWTPLLRLCALFQTLVHWLFWPVRFAIQIVAGRRAHAVVPSK